MPEQRGGEIDAAAAAAPASASAAPPAPAEKDESKKKPTGQIGARLARSGYSHEHLDGEDWQETPWVRPDVIKARDFYRASLYEGGQAPLWKTKISGLASLGVGVSLHFKLVRYLTCFFILATCAAIPALAICFAGVRLTEDEMDPLHVAKVSIANVGDRVSLQNYTVSPWPGSSVTYTARQASAVLMATDFGITWLFLLFILFLYGRIRSVVAEVDASVITASDYAVFVHGLPKDATEEEVRKHFDGLYNLRRPDWTFPSSCSRLFIGRKMWPRRQFKVPDKAKKEGEGGKEDGNKYRELRDADVYPVLDARNTGSPAYLKSWVAEVSIATANGSIIQRYQALTRMMQRMRTAKAGVKKYSAGSAYADEKRRAAAMARLEGTEKELREMRGRYSRAFRDECVGAFVIFQNETSLRRCLEDYAGSDSWTSLGAYWLQPPPLRFRGKHRLSVSKAPDPSQIIWQNLELTACQRFLRQTGVNALLLLLLAISFLFIILAQAQQARFRQNVPNILLCDSVLPAIAYNQPIVHSGSLAPGGSLPSSLTFNHDKADPTCQPLGFDRFYWRSDDPTAVSQTSRGAANPCLNECVNVKGSCSWPNADGGNTTFPLTTVAACYCLRIFSEAIAAKGIFTGPMSIASTEGGTCATVATDFITYNAFILVASAIVVIINMLLRTILSWITSFEGHPSVAAMNQAIALKVFLSLFLNTAVICLIVNAALPSSLSNLTLGQDKVFSGQYTGFDARWHVAVGCSIVLTLLINIVTPHMWNLYQLVCVRPCRRLSGDNAAVTQAELNRKFTPEDWEMPSRTAVLMNSLFCAFMYSSGHPVLYAVAAASFALTYVVDKWALLRINRRPPLFDEAMAVFAVGLMPYAAVAHLLISIWMYSQPDVLWSPQVFGGVAGTSVEVSALTGKDLSNSIGGFVATAGQDDSSGFNFLVRLTRENTLPLFLLLCLFIISWFLYRTAGRLIWVMLKGCCFCVSRGRWCRAGNSGTLQFNPPYTGPYALPLDGSKKHELTPFEKKAGWHIVSDSGFLVKIRTWPRDGVTFGLIHRKGQRMLTWQVIATQGIASYDLAANPLYGAAAFAIEMARRRAQESKAGGKASGKGAAGAEAGAGGGTAAQGMKTAPSYRRLAGAASMGRMVPPPAAGAGGVVSPQQGVTANPVGSAASPGEGGAAAGGEYAAAADAAAMAAAAAYGQYGQYAQYGGGYSDPAYAGMYGDPSMAFGAGGGGGGYYVDPVMGAGGWDPSMPGGGMMMGGPGGAGADPYGYAYAAGAMGMYGAYGAGPGGGGAGYGAPQGFDPASLAAMGFDPGAFMGGGMAGVSPEMLLGEGGPGAGGDAMAYSSYGYGGYGGYGYGPYAGYGGGAMPMIDPSDPEAAGQGGLMLQSPEVYLPPAGGEDGAEPGELASSPRGAGTGLGKEGAGAPRAGAVSPGFSAAESKGDRAGSLSPEETDAAVFSEGLTGAAAAAGAGAGRRGSAGRTHLRIDRLTPSEAGGGGPASATASSTVVSPTTIEVLANPHAQAASGDVAAAASAVAAAAAVVAAAARAGEGGGAQQQHVSVMSDGGVYVIDAEPASPGSQQGALGSPQPSAQLSPLGMPLGLPTARPGTGSSVPGRTVIRAAAPAQAAITVLTPTATDTGTSSAGAGGSRGGSSLSHGGDSEAARSSRSGKAKKKKSSRAAGGVEPSAIMPSQVTASDLV